MSKELDRLCVVTRTLVGDVSALANGVESLPATLPSQQECASRAALELARARRALINAAWWLRESGL